MSRVHLCCEVRCLVNYMQHTKHVHLPAIFSVLYQQYIYILDILISKYSFLYNLHPGVSVEVLVFI